MSYSKHETDYKNILNRMLSGNKLALAKCITFVENDLPFVPEIMEKIYSKTGKSFSIGVTGPPGAGKSTLVDKLIARIRASGLTVGIIAIDPSSPFSGGAVLGDRIRMQRHSLDDGVFIRSLGTRGTHGGLSRATGDVMRLFDVFGMDVVIIETVGVGQTELDIVNIADSTLVVLVPEAGDTIQTMKAGLMEIADIFIVNKADRDGADKIMVELKTMVEMKDTSDNDWNIPVLLCQASHDKGVDEIYDIVYQHQAYMKKFSELNDKTGKLRRQELNEIIVHRFCKTIESLEQKDKRFRGYFEKVEAEKSNPYKIAKEIFQDSEFAKKIFDLD